MLSLYAIRLYTRINFPSSTIGGLMWCPMEQRETGREATQSDYKWAFPQDRVNSDTLDTKTDVVFAFAAFSFSIAICTMPHNKWYHLCFPFLFLRDILRFLSLLQNIPICSNCVQWADENINQICKYETV